LSSAIGTSAPSVSPAFFSMSDDAEMPEVELPGVTIAYNVFGPTDGEPVVLVCGLSQPAAAWEFGLVPALVEAGYRVVTFDNRGVAPSSSPPAPYTVDEMVDDTVGLLDHLGLDGVRIAGYSMGGWIAETLAFRHPARVTAAVFIGSCNEGTSWEKAITTVERDLARLDPELPALFNAVETMRYLPNHELQNDETVDLWLGLIGGLEPWPNPGRLGQYEAALAWSLDVERTNRWPSLAVPCLILSFEHDVDSPPARARQAADRIPGARFVELAGASHLGVFTHAEVVAATVVDFFARAGAP
jgi:thioesterase CepJ